jgi:hypothetical protein
MGRRGDSLNVRAHTGTDIKQQYQVHGHVFACEVTNVAGLAGFLKDEIFRTKAGYGAVTAVYDLRVDPGKGDVTFKYYVSFGCAGGKQAESATGD